MTNRQNRILLCANDSSFINSFLLDVCRELLDRGHHIHVSCRNPESLNIRDQRISTSNYPFPTSLNPFLLPKLIKLAFLHRATVSNLQPHIIYVHTPIAAHIIRFIHPILFPFSRIQIVYHVHGFRFYPLLFSVHSICLYLQELLLSRFTHRYIVMNQFDFHFARFFSHQSKSSFTLIPGVGVYLPRFINSQPSVLPSPHSSQAISICVLARYLPTKGYNELLAFAKLCEPYNIQFHCYGSGNPRPFQDAASSLKLSNIFFHPHTSHIPELLQSAHFLLLFSHREGLCISIQEALASSTPVICSSVRGCIDLIDDTSNGFLITDTTTASFTNLLHRILSLTPIEYSAMCLRARESAVLQSDSLLLSKRIADAVTS